MMMLWHIEVDVMTPGVTGMSCMGGVRGGRHDMPSH